MPTKIIKVLKNSGMLTCFLFYFSKLKKISQNNTYFNPLNSVSRSLTNFFSISPLFSVGWNTIGSCFMHESWSFEGPTIFFWGTLDYMLIFIGEFPYKIVHQVSFFWGTYINIYRGFENNSFFKLVLFQGQ